MKLKSKTDKLSTLALLTLPIWANIGKCETGLHLSPKPAPRILGIKVDASTKLVTLRWVSNISSSYLIEESSDPSLGWTQSLFQVNGDLEETSYTFVPTHSQDETRAMFFRVRELAEVTIDSSEENVLPTATESREPTDPSENLDPQTTSLTAAYTDHKQTDQEEPVPTSTPEAPKVDWKQFHLDAILSTG